MSPRRSDPFAEFMARNPLPEPPKPDPELLDGTAWDRKDYRRSVDDRVWFRQLAIFDELDVDKGDFDLACRLVDNEDAFLRLIDIMRMPNLAEARARLDEIACEEYAEYRQYMAAECARREKAERQRVAVEAAAAAAKLACVACSDGVVKDPRYPALQMCPSCEDVYFAGPSTPPAGGIQSALARARTARVPATLTVNEWIATVGHFGGRCAYCGGPWSLVEHATSISLGGGTTAANCLPACAYCNSSKRSKRLEEMSGERVEIALAWLRLCGR